MNPITGKAVDRVTDPSGNGPAFRPAVSGDDVSLVAVLNVMLRHWRLLVLLPLALGSLTLVSKLLQPRMYTATASFIPQQSNTRQAGAMASMAAQFGFTLPPARPSESPAFYADLLKSKAILGALVDAEYSLTDGSRTRSGSITEIYEIDGSTDARRRERAVNRLDRSIRVTPSRQTDIVRFTVRSQYPQLAKQIADRALLLVNEFNLEKRQSHAREERRFVEGRLAAVKGELRQSEDQLREFLQSNRAFRNSAELTLRHDAIEREVGMRQAVYTSLAQAYEQARLDEVRNIPVITVLDPPEEPVRGDARGTVAAVLFVALIGFVIAAAIVLVLEFLTTTKRREGAEYQEFSRIRHEILSDLRRPWRILRWEKVRR